MFQQEGGERKWQRYELDVELKKLFLIFLTQIGQ